MSAKKDTSPILSEEERNQVQCLLEQYHQLASDLRNSTNQQEAEAALSPLTAITEPAQLALPGELSKENHTDAADILLGINALAPSKEVRKEARRALLRLETAHVHPQCILPITQTPAVQVQQPNAPRFWKGWVSQTREEGELELFLTWEQSYDYSEVRHLIFLLDFWEVGVKDCIVALDNKRRTEEQINRMQERLGDTSDCTLAEARRLVLEALSVNTRHGIQPHDTYHNNLPIINSLLLNNPDLGTDQERTFINPELMEQEVIINFLGAWSMGDYGLTYDLLSKDSPLRDNLTRDEWSGQHLTWAQEAHPTRLEISFIREIEAPQGLILLPGTRPRPATHKDIEIGWSLELLDTQLSGTLKEMPMGTAVNKDTGRHWFWSSFSLLREQHGWRIQRISDEGARAQGLAIPELQRRAKEQEQALADLLNQQRTGRPNQNEQQLVQEVSWRLSYLLHYYDALIVHLPLDYAITQNAYNNAVQTGNSERMQVYLERILQRFPQQDHTHNLRNLGSVLVNIAYKIDDTARQTRRQHLLTRAEEMLRQAIAEDNSALSFTLLAELFIATDRNDEAKEELVKARALASTPQETSVIEAGLGNLDMRQELFDEAITHFQYVTELAPTYPGIWFSLGFAQRLKGDLATAETSYQRAIETHPNDIRPFIELIALNMNQGHREAARKIAQQGIHFNPESASLYALLSSILLELNDIRGAQHALQHGAELDPTDEFVQAMYQQMQQGKKH